MTCMVVRKEESTEMSDISEAEITLGPAVIDGCVMSDRVYDYYLDELEESQADQVAHHFENCSYCRKIYGALEKVVTTLKRNPRRFFANEIAARDRKKESLPKKVEATD
jgi:hypothetical protein